MLYAHHDVQPPGDGGAVGQPAVRAHRARRPPLRPRCRRRQGRGHGARRRPARARGRPAGRGRRLRRGGGGDRVGLAADDPRAARRPAAGRRDRARRLHQLGDRRAGPDHDPARHGAGRRHRDDPRPRRALRPCSAARCPTPSPPWCGCSRGCTTTPETSPCRGSGRARRPTSTTPRSGCAQESGLLDGVSTIGTGSLLSRIWTKPSITTIGIDAPSVAHASNTLVPSASAKLSMRIAPDQDDRAAFEALRDHLLATAPWGARVEVTLDEHGLGFAADASGPVYDQARAAFHDAWGVEPVDIGVGGSIPFVAAFARAVPRRRDPRHRRRGPRRPGARRQRVAAPRGVREGVRRRGRAPRPAGSAFRRPGSEQEHPVTGWRRADPGEEMA